MFNFNEGFKVYVDGVEWNNVVAIQMSVDRSDDKPENNKVSLFVNHNGYPRVHTIELGGVSFENVAAVEADVAGDAV